MAPLIRQRVQKRRPRWFLRDLFHTAQAAPITTPRTAEPGPGTFARVDTESVMPIAGGALSLGARAVPTNGDPRLTTVSPYPQICGRALLARIVKANSAGWKIGWSSGTAGNLVGATMLFGADITYQNNVSITTNRATATATEYDVAIILRGGTAGAWALIRGGAYPTWTLVAAGWVTAAGSLYGAAGASTTGGTGTVDTLRAIDLAGAWADPYGIASHRTAAPVTGDTATSDPDGIVECVWTPAAAEVFELSARRTDDNNRWILRADQAAGTVTLIERNAGAETPRGSFAYTQTVGTPLHLHLDMYGTSIRIMAGPISTVTAYGTAVYASASFNQTATGVKVAGFATAANLVCWPRTVQLPAGV